MTGALAPRIRTRTSLAVLTLFAALGASAGCASAQGGGGAGNPSQTRAERAAAERSAGAEQRRMRSLAADSIGTPHDDVVLEVPKLWVDSLGLTVDSLDARLSLDANVINLVQVTAGVDLRIDSVVLELERVSAEAYLYVDLDNVARLVDRTLATLERNPEIVTHLLSTVDTLVSTVGGVAGQAVGPGGVLSRTVNQLGQTVEHTVTGAGDLVERTLDSAGGVVSQRTLGRLASMDVVSETTNAAGQTVRRVRDTAGRVIEYVTDTAGRVTQARIVGGR